MSKTPLVIGVFGAAGCLALSLLMQRALTLQGRNTNAPLEQRLGAALAGRIAGPVAVDEVADAGRRRLVVRAVPLAELPRRDLVDAIERTVWRELGERGIDEVRVELATSGGDPTVAVLQRPRPTPLPARPVFPAAGDARR